MAFKLIYTAVLQQTDRFGNPNGASYSFSGSQLTATDTPQAADLNTLAVAAGADLSTQLQAKYLVEQADDSVSDGSGGGG